MAANYSLVTSQSTIQVLSPTVVQDSVVATIQSHPSNVIADLWMSKSTWDDGDVPGMLSAFAANIETIMAGGKVVSAVGGRTLDANGLLESTITFTVGYKQPGSPFPPATLDVSIPTHEIFQSDTQGRTADITSALAEIDAAYQQLVVAAGGTPVTSPAPTPSPPAPAEPPAR